MHEMRLRPMATADRHEVAEFASAHAMSILPRSYLERGDTAIINDVQVASSPLILTGADADTQPT